MRQRKKGMEIPPGLSWILKIILPKDNCFSLLGDTKEIYRDVAQDKGRRAALFWIWSQLLVSVPRFFFYSSGWRLIMLKNYIKVALRNIKRHKGYAFINLVGLTLGIASCILIVFYIASELNYDRFHEKAEQIYRIGTRFELGQMRGSTATSNHPLGNALVRNYPEVLSSTKIRPSSGNVLVESEGREFSEDRILFAEATVFDVFTFPMISGDPVTALRDPLTAVITETTARKYFGNQNPIGKVLRFDKNATYTITGVVKDVPTNSHFTFDILCSFETLYLDNPRQKEQWLGDINNYTYVVLQKGFDYRKLEAKFPALIEKHMGRILKALGGNILFLIQPLTDIHLRSNLEGDISANSNIAYVYIFSAVALFILLIACFNFMNLSTARSARRAKEVGLRKVLGSQRKEIIRQFIAESILYSFMASILALLLAVLTLPLFRSLSGAAFAVSVRDVPWIIPGLAGFVLIVGILAGSYPAFFLSSFMPVKVLKGNLKTGSANPRFRSLLVVVQFTISITLIVGTLVVIKQLTFMKDTKLGFNKEQVIVLQIKDASMRENLDVIKKELNQIPGVLKVAVSSHVPGNGARFNVFLPEGFARDESQLMGAWSVDSDLLDTLGIELKSGRNFSPLYSTDDRKSILINETAARLAGWDDPLGKTFTELVGNGIRKRVIGVVKDFHFASLHERIRPLIIENERSNFWNVSLRVAAINISQTMDSLEKKWRKINPLGTFDYSFLDQSFDSQYRAEERLSSLFSAFSLLAILIACMGLFGLASFMAEQRKKEVGIRKVLGASVPQIFILMSKEFGKWILIANLLALPLAYLAMSDWLQDFPYRTSLSPILFIFSTLLSIVVALVSVSYQVMRTAVANPVNALKYE